MKKLQNEIDKLVPKTWEGIDWLNKTDSVLAREREAAGLPGITRERCRQVRRMVEEGLRKDPKKSKLLGVNGLKPINWHKMAETQAQERRVLDLYLPEVRLARQKAGLKDVEEMTPEEVGSEVGCKAAWVSGLLRREGKKYRCGGLVYYWERVAPIEWYLLTDSEIGKRVGCENVSVVAQYRDRHGGLKKYDGAECLTILRQLLKGLSGKERVGQVRQWLSGGPILINGLPAVAELRAAGADGEAEALAVSLPSALDAFRRLMRRKFHSEDWYLTPEEARLERIKHGKLAVKDELEAAVTESRVKG